jgi:hypothetical protein
MNNSRAPLCPPLVHDVKSAPELDNIGSGQDCQDLPCKGLHWIPTCVYRNSLGCERVFRIGDRVNWLHGSGAMDGLTGRQNHTLRKRALLLSQPLVCNANIDPLSDAKGSQRRGNISNVMHINTRNSRPTFPATLSFPQQLTSTMNLVYSLLLLFSGMSSILAT